MRGQLDERRQTEGVRQAVACHTTTYLHQDYGPILGRDLPLLAAIRNRLAELIMEIKGGQFILYHAGKIAVASLEIELYRTFPPGSVLQELHVIGSMLTISGIEVDRGTAVEI